jgi:hypothetical protein
MRILTEGEMKGKGERMMGVVTISWFMLKKRG